MPEPEPNKKWDALLRAYAKKHRRDIEPHPASRRALQDEVKKTFGQSARASKRSLFSNWWLRLPLAAIFATFAVLLVIQNRRFEESKGAGSAPAVFNLADAPAPARPAVSRNGASLPNSTTFGGADHLDSDIAAARAPSPSTQNSVAVGGAVPGGAEDLVAGQSPTANLPPTALSHAGRTRQFANQNQLSTVSKLQNNISQQIVLRSFAVTRLGDNISITDSDGSIYSGRVEPAQAQAQTGVYNFTVSGRNQSSQQTVVFRGRIEPLVSQALNDNNSAQANNSVNNNVANNSLSQNQLNQSQSAQFAQAPPSRVLGTALVGGTNRIDVDAILPP